MRPQVYIASDYAGFETPKLKVYYGYEEIDPNTEEWCFVVWKNGKEVFRVPNSHLDDIASDSPESRLLAGLALYLSK